MSLTAEQRDDYERAAVALMAFNKQPAKIKRLARVAYKQAEEKVKPTEMVSDIERRAARLLRECIAAGRPL